MKKDLYIDGIQYLTAREAGDVLDYAPDYISRLCREGRLRGRRSGKSWIVEADSLVPFLKRHEAKKDAWHSDLSRELKSVGNGRMQRLEQSDSLDDLKIITAPKKLHAYRESQTRIAARSHSFLPSRIVTTVGIISLLFLVASAYEIGPQRIAESIRKITSANSALNQTAAITTLGPAIDSTALTLYRGASNFVCNITE